MSVGVLIGVMITIVVGVVLIPLITSTVADSDVSDGVKALVNILPIFIITFVVIGLFASLARGASSPRKKDKDNYKLSKRYHQVNVNPAPKQDAPKVASWPPETPKGKKSTEPNKEEEHLFGKR